jgi:hypothetical protein
MIAYLYDFLHFYYNTPSINFTNISELKSWLIKDGYSLKTINLILNNLGKKVQININDIGNCYENEVIINNNYIYFDSLYRFK